MQVSLPNQEALRGVLEWKTNVGQHRKPVAQKTTGLAETHLNLGKAGAGKGSIGNRPRVENTKRAAVQTLDVDQNSLGDP